MSIPYEFLFLSGFSIKYITLHDLRTSNAWNNLETKGGE